MKRVEYSALFSMKTNGFAARCFVAVQSHTFGMLLHGVAPRLQLRPFEDTR